MWGKLEAIRSRGHTTDRLDKGKKKTEREPKKQIEKGEKDVMDTHWKDAWNKLIRNFHTKRVPKCCLFLEPTQRN